MDGICRDPYLPIEAEVIECIHESSNIFTLKLSFVERDLHLLYHYQPGQFNMVYLYGVGEVAISIVSDPNEKHTFSHTIRAIGRVTKALQRLSAGDRLGIRGPFGRGWPLHQAQGKDIMIITGGLGCAPTVSVINYIQGRRSQYGQLRILQGVRHTEDFIFRKQYEKWQQSPQTEIYLAASQAAHSWPWNIGYVTDTIQTLDIHPENTIAMMCGPEMMMRTAIKALKQKNVVEHNIYLSMERNMECGIGQCGHCQYGGYFICKDGPVFAYPEIKELFNVAGF